MQCYFLNMTQYVKKMKSIQENAPLEHDIHQLYKHVKHISFNSVNLVKNGVQKRAIFG